MDEGGRLPGELKHAGKLLRDEVGANKDLAIRGGEGSQVLGRVPSNVDDVRVLVSGDDALVLGRPDQELLVLARRGEEGAVRGPRKRRDVPVVSAGEDALLLPVVLGDDLDVPRGGRHGEGAAVGMPDGPAAGVRVGLDAADDSVDLADELRVLGGERVDVDDAVGARQGEHASLGVEGQVLGRLAVLLQGEQPGVVVDADQLDGQLVAGDGAPLGVGREGDIADGQRGAQQEAVEGVGVERVVAHGAVLGAGDEEVVARGHGEVLLLAVVDIGGLAVEARLVEADRVVGPDRDELAAVGRVCAARGPLCVRRPWPWARGDVRRHQLLSIRSPGCRLGHPARAVESGFNNPSAARGCGVGGSVDLGTRLRGAQTL